MTTPSQMPESLKVVAWLLAYPNREIGFYLSGCIAWPDELSANKAASIHVATGLSEPVVRLSDATAALKDRDAEIERLKKDSERLDHLQSRLATVEVLPAGLAWKFQVGGFHGGASHNIRAAIDAAIDSMNGGANG